MYQNIIFENSGGVATITLNRPEVYHALNASMMLEITAALRTAAQDASCRVVVLGSTGDKAFCSGADLKEAAGSQEGAGAMLEKYYEPMILAIRQMPKPVICRVQGLAVGAGSSLALACDLVVASDNAYFSFLFVQIGLMPDAGLTFILPRLIGPAKAFDLASTGRKITAKEAAEIGLIAQCIPAAELDTELQKRISYYRHAPTLSIAATKQAFNQSLNTSLTEMLKFERENQQNLFQTADVQEGISSFLQKKKPDFQGR